MPDKLVTVHLGPVFRNFREQVEKLQTGITVEGGKIVRREVEASMRQRWYRSGKAVGSLTENIVSEGNSKTYRLVPTATSKSGAPYPLFGEYGTGLRGRLSGRPAPKGYRYGDQPGMRARRFSRIALTIAQPQVKAKAEQLIRNFTV